MAQVRPLPRQPNAGWCNGSTSASGALSQGSNPCLAAMRWMLDWNGRSSVKRECNSKWVRFPPNAPDLSRRGSWDLAGLWGKPHGRHAREKFNEASYHAYNLRWRITRPGGRHRFESGRLPIGSGVRDLGPPPDFRIRISRRMPWGGRS